MVSAGDRLWAGYFYPETFDTTTMRGTLRNLFGERDARILQILEHGAMIKRQQEVMSGSVTLPRTFDAEHVRFIHRHLFQDVYGWAGEYRKVNIFKGTPRGFADVNEGEIDRYLNDVARLVKITPWANLRRGDFAEHAAIVFAYLNTGGSTLIEEELIGSANEVSLGLGRVSKPGGDVDDLCKLRS